MQWIAMYEYVFMRVGLFHFHPVDLKFYLKTFYKVRGQ